MSALSPLGPSLVVLLVLLAGLLPPSGLAGLSGPAAPGAEHPPAALGAAAAPAAARARCSGTSTATASWTSSTMACGARPSAPGLRQSRRPERRLYRRHPGLRHLARELRAHGRDGDARRAPCWRRRRRPICRPPAYAHRHAHRDEPPTPTSTGTDRHEHRYRHAHAHGDEHGHRHADADQHEHANTDPTDTPTSTSTPTPTPADTPTSTSTATSTSTPTSTAYRHGHRHRHADGHAHRHGHTDCYADLTPTATPTACPDWARVSTSANNSSSNDFTVYTLDGNGSITSSSRAPAYRRFGFQLPLRVAVDPAVPRACSCPTATAPGATVYSWTRGGTPTVRGPPLRFRGNAP